ncbi:MAG: STAS domain-containing protein [Planctomycetota bacterium]
MANRQSHVSVKYTSGVQVVEFAERKILEELSISEIGEELAKLVALGGKAKLLLSFKNVEHLSSAALGMLITLNRQVEQAKGELRLADISPPIYEVFKITRLNKLFKICATTEEAMESF